MNLSNSQRKFLRGLTHHLEPVVMVADKGLSDNVRAEIEQALEHHELIKVKLRAEREQRNAWVAEITTETGAQLVHQIGQVACFYRRHPKKPKISLPR
jgi:RNA-binding protein